MWHELPRTLRTALAGAADRPALRPVAVSEGFAIHGFPAASTVNDNHYALDHDIPRAVVREGRDGETHLRQTPDSTGMEQP